VNKGPIIHYPYPPEPLFCRHENTTAMRVDREDDRFRAQTYVGESKFVCCSGYLSDTEEQAIESFKKLCVDTEPIK
jgi:hypothetical protein